MSAKITSPLQRQPLPPNQNQSPDSLVCAWLILNYSDIQTQIIPLICINFTRTGEISQEVFFTIQLNTTIVKTSRYRGSSLCHCALSCWTPLLEKSGRL